MHIIFAVFGDISGGPVVDAEVRLVAVDGIEGTSNQQCKGNSTRYTRDRRRRVKGSEYSATASVFFNDVSSDIEPVCASTLWQTRCKHRSGPRPREHGTASHWSGEETQHTKVTKPTDPISLTMTATRKS